MTKKYDFRIEQILEMISLYQARVPTTTIAKLYGINNVTLWILLKKYEKICLIKFRSRSETALTTLSKKRTNPVGEKINRVKIWKKKFGEEGLIDILTIFLITDASADYEHKIIRLTNSDQTALEIFTDILNEFDLNPRKTIDSRNNLQVVFSRNNKVRKILEEVYLRTPTTKHQPQRGTEDWGIYFKQKQPSISFLYNRPKELIELCFRIGITLDGCVIACKSKDRALRPTLKLTCFHPTLLKEWQKTSEIVGLNMSISGKTIRTRSVNSAEKFLKIGNFIKGIKICSKSKNYKGIEKSQRLKDLLKEYYNKK